MGEFISQELANSVGNSVNLDNNSHSNQWEVGGSLVAGRASEVWAFAKLHFRHEALLTAASFLALWLTGWTDQLYLQSSSTKKSYGKLFFLTFWGLCRRHSADVCASQRFIESWLYRVIDAPVALCMFSYVTDMLGRPQLNQTILQRCAMCLLMRTGHQSATQSFAVRHYRRTWRKTGRNRSNWRQTGQMTLAKDDFDAMCVASFSWAFATLGAGSYSEFLDVGGLLNLVEPSPQWEHDIASTIKPMVMFPVHHDMTSWIIISS